MKALIMLLLLVSSAAAYDPMETVQPGNATDQVVDSIVIGLHNATPYLISITILGFFAVTFAAIGVAFYVMGKSNG